MLAVMVLVAGYPTYAMAYVDPGTGNAIMSIVIGLIVAISLFFKTFWFKIRALFSRTSSSVDKPRRLSIKKTNLDEQG